MNWLAVLIQIWIVLFFECDLTIAEENEEACAEESNEFTAARPKWFKKMIPKNYSNFHHPPNHGCPSSVLVEYVPLAIGEISVLTMTIEIDIAVWVLWTDSRLILQDHDRIGFISSDMFRLWKPNLRFRGCKNCKVLEVERRDNKLWLRRGYLTFSNRVAEKFSCKFDLSAYPMDNQMCVVEIESSQEDKSSVKLTDISKPENLTAAVRAIQLTEFKIIRVMKRNCSKKFFSDKLSCISFGFVLKREMTYHLMLTYCPSMLIVILSWFSFWLDAETSAPRVTLGLTSLLTLATQFANAQKNLPAISYVKAIDDVWMFVCMFMVFASLLEFAIANNMARFNRLRSVIPVKVAPIYQDGLRILKKPVNSQNKKQDGGRPTIDKVAQILFPSTYIVFNICYWGCYGYFLTGRQ